ncbi:YIP1 family protein [Acidobacteriota bacterium]
MNFLNAFLGIFLNPKQTLKAVSVSENPRWAEALIIILIAWALFAYITAPIAQQDSIRVMEDNIKLKERVGEDQYNEMLENIKNPSPTSTLFRPFIMAPFSLAIGFLFSCLIMFGMGRLISTEGKYIQVFSGFLYVSFIDKILGNAVRLLLVLSKKSILETSTGLALFFPRLEVTSTAFIILTQVDIFQLWMFGVFSYALSYIFKVEVKKALFISYGFWILKTLFYIALGLFSASLMK